jgi:hypothetical protein
MLVLVCCAALGLMRFFVVVLTCPTAHAPRWAGHEPGFRKTPASNQPTPKGFLSRYFCLKRCSCASSLLCSNADVHWRCRRRTCKPPVWLCPLLSSCPVLLRRPLISPAWKSCEELYTVGSFRRHAMAARLATHLRLFARHRALGVYHT